MPKFRIIEPYWLTVETVAGGGAIVCHVVSRRRENEHRLAYWTPGAVRWRISTPVSASFTEDVMSEAQLDFRCSHFDLRSMRHMLKTHARVITPRRWSKHRRKMEHLKEARALSSLPQFGIF